jgi:riboflavin synthase alpha subunit
MFTGIVTDVGTVRTAEQRGDLRLVIACCYDMDSVDLGASIACWGVCLTVVDKGDDWFAVDVSGETLSKTAADHWREGARLNLERSLRLGDEIGGQEGGGGCRSAFDEQVVDVMKPVHILRILQDFPAIDRRAAGQ